MIFGTKMWGVLSPYHNFAGAELSPEPCGTELQGAHPSWRGQLRSWSSITAVVGWALQPHPWRRLEILFPAPKIHLGTPGVVSQSPDTALEDGAVSPAQMSPGLNTRWVAGGEDRSHPHCPATCHHGYSPGTNQQAEPRSLGPFCPRGCAHLCDSSVTAVSLLVTPLRVPLPLKSHQPRHQLSLEVKAARTGPGCSSLLLCWDEGHLLPDGHFGGTNVRPRGPGLVAREGFVLGSSSVQGLGPRAAQGHPSPAQGHPRVAQGHPSPGYTPTLGPRAPCSRCSAAQVHLAPHGGCSKGCLIPPCAQPQPLLARKGSCTPCLRWGAALFPPPCHQHGHQPGLCPKMCPQPPLPSEVSLLLQRCGMEATELAP